MKKIAIAVLKICCTALMLIISPSDLFSQQRKLSIAEHNGWYIGLGAGQSKSHIVNEGELSVSGLVSNKMNVKVGSFEIGYFFTRYFGLSAGIGFDAWKTQLLLDSYESKFNTTDSENESYQRQVTGTGIEELQEIDFLTVPLCMNLRIPVTRSVGLFMQAGANVAIPVNSGYSGSGTFSYKGYYPAYNVLLENLPAYGFPNNYHTVAEGDLDLKKYAINAIVSAGFEVFVQKNMQIGVAAFYSKSLSTISAYASDSEFRLTSDVDQLNSLMGGCSKVSLQSMGLKLSIRYYLNSHL